MNNFSGFKPRVFPYNGDIADAEIDRAQGIDYDITTNSEEVDELGRDGKVGDVKKPSDVTYKLTQLEYGNMEFFRKIANKADTVQTINLNDFKTSMVDLCAYLQDDNLTFKGTIWYPKLRTSGFSFTIGDPKATIERSFDLVGETAKILQGNNKYFIYVNYSVGSGNDNIIDLSAKVPVEDPNITGKYMQRVLRVSSGVTTELVETTDYSYDNVNSKLTIVSVITGDTIKVYYTSSTAPDAIFTNNDVDPAAILADSVDIYLYVPASGKPSSADYVYRLQSVGIDVSFTREDQNEVGSTEPTSRGISKKEVSISLGRLLEKFSIEEVLAGKAAGWGIIDVDNLTDNATVIVKVYSDNTKSTFKYGFKSTGLSMSDLKGAAAVNTYTKEDNTLKGDNLQITDDVLVLGV